MPSNFPPRPGPKGVAIDKMLRVDHAGEYGAVAIYRGQRAVFDQLRSKKRIAAQIADMEAGEAEHLKTFSALLSDRQIRPSLLSPLWNIAGFGLGAASALMGEKAAMACTAAVEDVIERHYAAQAAALRETEPALSDTIERFCEDERGHKDEAEAAGARQAPAYWLLSRIIKAGCRASIKIAEQI